MARIIREKLEAALGPCVLAVEDESEAHRGHAGYREGGGTHFRVEIISDRFAGLSRIERHRLVHALLENELKSGIHALSLKADTFTENKEKTVF